MTHHGDKLKQFCKDNKLKNSVIQPTRVITTKIGTSSTAIDVMLHNHNSLDQTQVIDFPHSDHCIVLTCCHFKREFSNISACYRRYLNPNNIKRIIDALRITSFDFLSDVYDVELKYFFFKRILLKIIKKLAPLKLSSNRKKKKLPWFDNDLLRARRFCDKLLTKYKRSSSNDDKISFTEQRNSYQT